ncbi:MAG: alanine--tRNA ligase-related protein, partial [Elstera sp.]
MSAFLTGANPDRAGQALWPMWSQRWLAPTRRPPLPQETAPMSDAIAPIFPATEDLFRSDAYRTEEDAQVLAVVETEKGAEILLNRTLFYPNGGGQPGDTGVIVSPSGDEIRILD